MPPETGSAERNPDGVWSIDAQLQTELFGLIAPGMPDEASRRAAYFARVTNSGLAVEVSAFYAALYAQAYFDSDLDSLLRNAQARFPSDSQLYEIVETVFNWHALNPDDWRVSRALIRERYDDDPMWWAAKVNFASTLMALLYGEGDLLQTMTLAGLAGWDADNNMTTAATTKSGRGVDAGRLGDAAVGAGAEDVDGLAIRAEGDLAEHLDEVALVANGDAGTELAAEEDV
ncbi:MAG: ADP-ribosylglycohydrolase family protein, partial [Caldilineaceae bacterium]|nr:ADP-ribosylglycohydrolase family protein [Caldilineaceae bacterium]